MGFEIVLASASPRRRELLEAAGVEFSVHAVDVDEALEPDDLADPAGAARKLAERKAHAAADQLLNGGKEGLFIVLGSDTMVALDAEVFGKPVDEADAWRMLRALSGNTHQVHTGVSLWAVSALPGEDLGVAFRSFTDTTQVTFRSLSDEDIAAYIATGDPMDKAGSYGIQSGAGSFVDRIDGALDTVIGLPVKRLQREFPDFF